jgi:xanthine dehydrogenase accessory factor
MSALFEALRQAIHREDAVAQATLVRGEPLGAKLLVYDDGHMLGSLGDAALDQAVAADARELLSKGEIETRTYRRQQGDEVDVYIESFLPPRRLVVIGAVHIAIPVVAMARELGYRTTVIDAREFFATRERFPHADELIVAWPDEAMPRVPLGPQTDIVILAHDEKFEDPALQVALRSRAGYIGAIGSRKTSDARAARLRQAGFSDEDIARIHGPIGIDIGAHTPAEIAVSILAEIIAVRRGRDPRHGSGLRPAKATTGQ